MCAYLRRAITLSVRFATKDTIVQTLEGPVSCVEGDAIVTGIRGENWPIQRPRFLATYQPATADMSMGSDGLYQRISFSVQARQLEKDESLPLGGGRGTLAGSRGDWLVQDAEGDCWIVANGIFQETYEPHKNN